MFQHRVRFLPKKLASLVVLRALVPLMIAASHTLVVVDAHSVWKIHPMNIRTGGVDFFFVLSGFLISYIYSAKSGEAGAVGSFMRKRLLRIYPLVWFFTIISLPFYFFLSGFGSGVEKNPVIILKSLFLVPMSVQPVLGATWSLSHVVAFYIFFSVYLLRARVACALTLLWLLLLVAYNFIGNAGGSYFFGFVFNPINLNFLVGILVAWFVRKYDIPFSYLWIFLGLSGFVIPWILLHDYAAQDLRVTLCYMFASAFLIVGGIGLDSTRNIRISKHIEVLANSSYAVIVVNLPVIVLLVRIIQVKTNYFSREMSIGGVLLIFMFLIGLAIVAGVAANKFIEPRVNALAEIFIYKISNFSKNIFCKIHKNLGFECKK